MRMVKGYVQTDKVGSRCEFEFDVDDDATGEEIEEFARDAMFSHVEWSYNVEQAEE